MMIDMPMTQFFLQVHAKAGSGLVIHRPGKTMYFHPMDLTPRGNGDRSWRDCRSRVQRV
jgi:hypothetical protein